METIASQENMNPELIIINNPEDMMSLYPKDDPQEVEKMKGIVLKDFESINKGESIGYGLKVEDRVVAMGQLRLVHENHEYADGSKRASLHHLRTAEEFRKKGFGTQLIQLMEDEAKMRGFKEMSLGVNSNNAVAIKLYMKLGYHEYMREERGNGQRIGMIKEI